MNSIRIQLLKHYPEAIETFGFMTKQNRLENNLDKEHCLDAAVIATNGQKPIFKTNQTFKKVVVGKENRSMSIFRKVPIQIPKGKMNGFRRYDKVLWNNQEYFVYGRMSSGYSIIEDINGIKPNTGVKTLGHIKTSKLQRMSARKSLMQKVIYM